MNQTDRAEKLFRQGYNCAQAVFGAFSQDLGLDSQEAMRLASPFGAGLGKLREVCGAVSGMLMVLGLARGYSNADAIDEKRALYALTQQAVHQFETENGYLLCRDLLHLKKGEDLEEPAVRTEEYYQTRPCLKAVRSATAIAQSLLSDPPSGGPAV